jgi:hypothetical protein
MSVHKTKINSFDFKVFNSIYYIFTDIHHCHSDSFLSRVKCYQNSEQSFMAMSFVLFCLNINSYIYILHCLNCVLW